MARLNDRTGKQEEVARPSAPANDVARVNVEAMVEEKERFWSGKLSKPTQERLSPVQGPGLPVSDPLGQAHPALVAFVRDCTYGDGTRRTPGSFVVFVQDGMYTVCLTDKTQQPNLVAFQAARTLTEALSLADQGLRSDSLHWRTPARSRQR